MLFSLSLCLNDIGLKTVAPQQYQHRFTISSGVF